MPRGRRGPGPAPAMRSVRRRRRRRRMLVGGMMAFGAYKMSKSQADQVNRMVEQTVTQYGRLDVAFNNAGSGGGGGPLAELSDSEWQATLLGYLTSTFYCMKAELKQMLAQGASSLPVTDPRMTRFWITQNDT